MPWEFVDEEPSKENLISKFGKESARFGARTASNILTRAAGLPGDIATILPEKSFLGQAAKKTLPTTEQHRKNLEFGFGEYLKPQNEIEKFVDNVVEDASMLFQPQRFAIQGAKIASPLMKGIKSLGKSLGANLIGTVAEQLSSNEKVGAGAKLGSLFLLSMMDKPKATTIINDLYKQAESSLPEGAKISAVPLNRELVSLEKKITKGRPVENLSASEKFVHEQIEKIKNLTKTGEAEVNQLWAQKKSLNEELAGKKLFEMGHKERKSVRSLAKPLVGYINNALEQYGKKNSGFLKSLKDADIAHGAIAQSNLLANFLEKHISFNPLTTGLLHMFGVPLAKSVGTVVFPYHLGKLAYRITKSPVLRKLYDQAMIAAIKEDASVFNKELAKLDEKLQEDEAKDHWEFID